MGRAELLNRILETRKSEASLRELAACGLSEFGGTAGIMREVKLQFDNAKVESEKTKMLIAVIDLVKQASALNKNSEDPINSMSDDELRGAVQTIFSE